MSPVLVLVALVVRIALGRGVLYTYGGRFTLCPFLFISFAL